MRRLTLAAVTFLHGAVACSSYETNENRVDDAGTAQTDGGAVVDTPVSPLDPTRTCVPRPPADWQGPLVLFEGSGAPAPDPPPCPSGYSSVYDGNSNLVAPDSQCACECGPETNATCVAKVVYFKDSGCFGPCAHGTQGTLGTTCGPGQQQGGGG